MARKFAPGRARCALQSGSSKQASERGQSEQFQKRAGRAEFLVRGRAEIGPGEQQYRDERESPPAGSRHVCEPPR